MRRCCYFFLSFIAVVILAVAMGSFDAPGEAGARSEDTSQVSIASQEEAELSMRSPLKVDADGTSEKSAP